MANNLPKDAAQAIRLLQGARFGPMDDMDRQCFCPEHSDATICYLGDLVVIKDGEDYVFCDADEDGQVSQRTLKLEGKEQL